ncbi:MAG: DUF5828 family protein [Candidatus Aenigmatarchaeota archaeon]
MPLQKRIKATNSGVKKRGNMEEIADFSERVREIIEGEEGNSSAKKFERWRPRSSDHEKDIKKKTVLDAVTEKTKAEKKGEGIKRDLSRAMVKTKEAEERVKCRKVPKNEAKEALKNLFRPLVAKLMNLLRTVEGSIYSKLMLKFNPYFFECRDFSVDLRKIEDDEYEMEVNTPQEENSRKLKGKFGLEK